MIGLSEGLEDLVVMLLPYAMIAIAGVAVAVMVYIVIRNRMIRRWLGL